MKENDVEFWGQKCPLKELKNSIKLSIEFEVEIFRLNMKQPIITMSHNELNLKEGMKQYIEYKMNEAEVNVFKTSLPQKALSREVVGLWALEAYPRGMEVEDDGDTGLHLMLCKLPPNVFSLKVDVRFHCKETDENYECTRVYILDNRGYGVAPLMSFSKVKHLKMLTFSAEIKIVKVIYHDPLMMTHVLQDEKDIAFALCEK